MKLSGFYEKINHPDKSILKDINLPYENTYNFFNQGIKFKSNSNKLLQTLAQSFPSCSQKTQAPYTEFTFIEKGPLSSRFVFTTPLSTHFIYKTSNGIVSIFLEKQAQRAQIAYLLEKPMLKLPLNKIDVLDDDEDDEQICSIIELLTTVAIMSLARKSYFFHAANLAWQGMGIILSGETMKGKTTQSLGLAYHGFEFLSDEITGLDLNTFKLIPFPKSVCIREKAFKHLPPIPLKERIILPEISGNKRFLVKTKNLGVKIAEQACIPRCVFLLQGFKKKSEIKETSPREALWQVLSSSYARIPDPPKLLFTLGPLFDRLKCYHLWSGKIEETVDLIQNIMLKETTC